MLWNAFVQRKSAGVGVGQTLTQHYTKYSSNNTPTEGLAALRGNISPSLISPIPRRGTAGGGLGECLANIHPAGTPLYNGVSDDWGECWAVSDENTLQANRDYGLMLTILRFFLHCGSPRKEVFRPRETGRPTMSRNTALYKSSCHFLWVVLC